MLNNLINKIKQLGREGLFHIFGSGVLAKVGGILSSVIVIRNLPKLSYGSFVDADNLYAYYAILWDWDLPPPFYSSAVRKSAKNAAMPFTATP